MTALKTVYIADVAVGRAASWQQIADDVLTERWGVAVNVNQLRQHGFEAPDAFYISASALPAHLRDDAARTLAEPLA